MDPKLFDLVKYFYSNSRYVYKSLHIQLSIHCILFSFFGINSGMWFYVRMWFKKKIVSKKFSFVKNLNFLKLFKRKWN